MCECFWSVRSGVEERGLSISLAEHAIPQQIVILMDSSRPSSPLSMWAYWLTGGFPGHKVGAYTQESLPLERFNRDPPSGCQGGGANRASQADPGITSSPTTETCVNTLSITLLGIVQTAPSRPSAPSIPEPVPNANHCTRKVKPIILPSHHNSSTNSPKPPPPVAPGRRQRPTKAPLAITPVALPARTPPPPRRPRPRKRPRIRRRPPAPPRARTRRATQRPRHRARPPRVRARSERPTPASLAAGGSEGGPAVRRAAGARGRVEGVDVCAAAGERGRGGHLAARQDDGDVDCCAVDLGLVHVGYGGLGVGLVREEDVSCAAVGVD